MLIVLAGLPGTGKSSLARALARDLGGVWLRIDSIEQALRASGAVPGPVGDAGYRAAYAIAEDNLLSGRVVIGDSVNPWMLTRDAWRDTGMRARVPVLEVETVCSDPEEHRRRVETRVTEVPGLTLPIWDEVMRHDYRAWTRDRLVIDTAGMRLDACIERVIAAL